MNRIVCALFFLLAPALVCAPVGAQQDGGEPPPDLSAPDERTPPGGGTADPAPAPSFEDTGVATPPAEDAGVATPPAEEAGGAEAAGAEELLGDELADGPAVAVDPAELEALMDGIVHSLQREHRLAGAVVSIVAGGEPLFAKGYGFADLAAGRPADAEETLFRIGSVSKTFIWTAAMMLAERGQLDLAADVNGYLRDVRVEEAFDRPVTMQDLMAHRAGFEDTLRLFAVADDDPRTLAELLIEHQPRRVYAPGTRTAYSNWGAALAAQVVEDVLGEPYGAFLQREILQPLQMNATRWEPPAAMDPAVRERLATGYRPARGGLEIQRYLQLGAYWPAGGMASTAADMTRWMRFHLNGGELDGVQLMAPDTHARMWTRAYADRPEAADVAHGFQDRWYRGVRTLAHSGGTAAFFTNMVLAPELGLGVFISQNSAQAYSPMDQAPERVIDRIRGDAYAPLLVVDGETAPLSELAGTYVSNRRVFSSFAAVLGAFNFATLTPVSEEAFTLGAMGELQYYRRLPATDDVYEAAGGERVAILRDERGRVAALADASGANTLERVNWLRSPITLLIAIGIAVLLALTTLSGTWWRLGRGNAMRSRLFGALPLLSAIAVLWFITSAVLLAIAFGEFDLAAMADIYPSPFMLHMHAAGWAVTGAAAMMALVAWPVWSSSHWRFWRRLHYSLFALALLFLAFQLWQWRIIGAEVI